MFKEIEVVARALNTTPTALAEQALKNYSRAVTGCALIPSTVRAALWVGYFEDEHTRVPCVALRELPGLEPWIAVGRHRRHTLGHSTPTIDGRAIGH